MTTTKPDQIAGTFLKTSTKNTEVGQSLPNPATTSVEMPSEPIQVRHRVRVKADGKTADGIHPSDGIRESASPSTATDADLDSPSAANAKSKSKSELMIELLKSNDGASVVELMEATNWLAHSVRGFLSGTIRKKFGLTLSSDKAGDGTRRYRIDIEVNGFADHDELRKGGEEGGQPAGPSTADRVG